MCVTARYMSSSWLIDVLHWSPKDGDIDPNTRWIIVLYPSAQVEEAGEQQVNGRHHCRQEQQISFMERTPFNVSLKPKRGISNEELI